MKRILAFVSLFILILGLSLVVFLVQERTKLPGQAATSGIFSPENSYVFASPLQASSLAQEKIRITVFVLDSQGLGVSGKTVFLGQGEKLTVIPVQAVTDDLGRALFDVSSSQAAEYLIEAQVEGKKLPQRLKVSFR